MPKAKAQYVYVPYRDGVKAGYPTPDRSKAAQQVAHGKTIYRRTGKPVGTWTIKKLRKL